MTFLQSKKALICLGIGLLSLPFSNLGNAADLPEKIEDGNILHCFNWSINEVKENLQYIADAGFVAVQLSPMQRPTAKRGDSWSDLYRPYDLSFQASEAMGSLEDLKDLCQSANDLGIKVIVDVVANHLDKTNYLNSWWDATGNQTRLRQNPGTSINYSDRNSITSDLIGDYAVEINSEAQAVLQKAKSFVTNLSSYGVAGIRWDAAKHIALPSEGSNFWPTVIQAVDGMFHYGEILDNPCSSNYGDLIKEYGDYMAVTDTYFSNEAAKSNDGLAKRKNGEYASLVGKGKVVYWAESHDTYSNTAQFGGWSNTVDQSVINRAYAAIACRDGAIALYLARPGTSGFSNIRLGKSSSEEQDQAGFRSDVVTQVNAFRNAMKGREEFFTKSEDGKTVCITRNNGGAVIITEPNSSFTVPNGGSYCPVIAASNGMLRDKITNNAITVTAETISGRAGETGVVVIYTTNTPAKPGVEVQDYDPIDITIYYDNSLTKWDQVNCHYWGGSQETKFPGLSMTKVENDSYGRDLYSITVPYGSNVLFAADNKTQTVNQKDVEQNHVYKGLLELDGTKHLVFDSGLFGEEPITDPGQDSDPNKMTIYYDNTETLYNPVYCYYYDGVESGKSFPGELMENVSSEIYKITVPIGSTVIFSTGSNVAQTVNVTGIKDGYLYKGNKATSGKDSVTEVGVYSEENNKEDDNESDYLTIYYDNSLTKYEEPVSCYYFATGLNPVKFPGTAMEYLGNSIYKIEIPKGEWTLIFDNGVNSGDNARQTENSHDIAIDGYIYQGQEELNTRGRNLLDDGKPYEDLSGGTPSQPSSITVYVYSQTAPYLYVWNGSDKLNGNFPGNLMDGDLKVTFGNNEYYAQKFTGYEYINLILTNEERVQTSNIENVSEDIFINWSGDNRFEIIDDPEGELNSWSPVALITVYYDNSQTLWDEVYCYTYGAGGEYLGGFPGKEMNDLGEEYPNIYYIEVPEGNSVIFNYKGSDNQTVDIDNALDGELFVGTDSPNTDGKYEVVREVFKEKEDPEEDDTEKEPELDETEFITIYYDDIYTDYSSTGNIGKVHCYYYAEDKTYTEWPGEEMEKCENPEIESYSLYSEVTQVLYKIEIPKNSNGVIFNDGDENSGMQTMEIGNEDLEHNRIYIGTLELDDENHHSIIKGNLYNDDTSGINNIYGKDIRDLFYDLQGIPTKNPQKGKIYLRDGKKILIL